MTAHRNVPTFDTDVLLQQLRKMHDKHTSDFGRHILPAMVNSHQPVAYDFDTSPNPGIDQHEEHACWREVGKRRLEVVA